MSPASTPAAAAAVADASTIASGALPLALAIAVLAGFVSFASPCVLPLVPGFLGYVTGLSDVALEDRRRSRMVVGALLFVVGFSAVFIATAVAASAVSSALRAYQPVLIRVGGAVVIVLALVFLGLGAQRTVRLRWRPAAGLAGAPVLGGVFAVGWAPCLGPTLGAILALTAPLSGDDRAIPRGVALATAYSLGLGVPFLLIAAGYSRFGRMSAWLRRHQRGIQVFGGVLLLAVGVLMVSGLWEGLVAWLQTNLVRQFRTVI